MKKRNKTQNTIETKGDDKLIIQNLKESAVEIENSIKVEGDNNIIIQESGSSKITIGGKEY